MRGIAMVAHPDDCIIFAWSFMRNHGSISWDICYLTYDQHDARAQEIAGFWNKRNINTKFLGYIDDYRDLESGRCSFDTDRAAQDIRSSIQDFDLVLTHNQEGDYGHLHHRFVHDVVAGAHDRIVTFSPPDGSGDLYSVPMEDYDIAELPMHGSIIQGFHNTQHSNRYHVPESVRTLLKDRK